MSSHTEAAYNKFTAQGKGTLVGNWNEERSLRDFTGVGRTIVKEHIPKRHLNFEEKITTDKVFDDTNQRIYGGKLNTLFQTETHDIGKSFNPADNLAKVGLKTKMQEQDILDKVRAEFEEKDKAEALAREQRRWDTQTGTIHAKMDYCQNTIGRKVMRTQDGVMVNLPDRDEQLIVEHGTWRRRERATEDELKSRVPKGDHTTQVPVTIWTHNLPRKNYYMSSAVGQNPFSKTHSMTQPADMCKGIVHYAGNIDLDTEAQRTCKDNQQIPNKTQYAYGS